MGQLHWLFVGQVTVAITVLVLRKVFRLSGLDSYLVGLRVCSYTPPGKTPGGHDVSIQPVSRRDRKLAAKQQAMIEEKGLMEGMVLQPLGKKTVMALTYADEFDFMVMLSAVLLVNACILGPITFVLKQSDTYLLISNLCMFILPYLTYLQIKVDLTSEVKQAVDKLYLMFFFWAGFFLSWTVLTAEDRGLFRGFNLQTGIDGLNLSITSFLNRVQERLQKEPLEQPFTLDPRFVAIYLSIGIGCVAVTILAPAARYARVYYQSGVDRPWGRTLLGQSTTMHALLPFTFLMPLACVLLQFRFFVNFWGLHSDWLPLIQPLCYLLTAFTHFLVLKPLCQSWLNSGLVDWYSAAHNGVEHPKKAEVIVLRLHNVRALLCKVATQLIGLAPLALCAAILMAFNSGWFFHIMAVDVPLNAAAQNRNNTALNVDPAQVASPPPPPPSADILNTIIDDEYDDDFSDVVNLGPASSTAEKAMSALSKALPPDADISNTYYFFGEYLGWWCSMCWCLYSFTMVAIYRTGLNIG